VRPLFHHLQSKTQIFEYSNTICRVSYAGSLPDFHQIDTNFSDRHSVPNSDFSLPKVSGGHGPFSKESDQTLEAIDGMVGQLIDAAMKNDSSTVVVIVSDHGFAKVDHALKIAIPFLQAGLIQAKAGADDKARIVSWKAEPWASGGLAAVMLHDPQDAKTRAEVRTMLDRLAADPVNGIARILGRDEIRAMGGFPDAKFLIALKPGYLTTGDLSGPLVSDQPPDLDTHGYLPTYPEMRASFFVLGQGVAHGRDLGVIDMRQIAPRSQPFFE
jgi:hypothetical protein